MWGSRAVVMGQSPLLTQARTRERSPVARGCGFRNIDEGVTRNQVVTSMAGPAGMLTRVATVTLCPCFARQRKRRCRVRKPLFSHGPATVHGVVFELFVWRAPFACRAAE